MRFAAISDTHFGDDSSLLVRWKDSNHSQAVTGPKYEEFKNAAGIGNDYLILLGDIFDFSICSYEETYRAGKVFFEQIQKDNIAKYIIYVPGNHDASIWHFYEQQSNVTRRIDSGQPPRPLRFSIPGIIDARKKPVADRFSLFGVSKNPDIPEFGYGGMFLDNITTTTDDKGNIKGTPLRFAFAYPNIYIVTDKTTIMLTHGQYLEGYWSILSKWAVNIAGKDLGTRKNMILSEMVAINFPLNQLACTGVGQAGPLSKVVRLVQKDYKNRDFKRIKKYIDNLDNEIDKLTPSRWPIDIREGLTDMISNYLKKKLIENLEKSVSTRYSDEFIQKPEVLERFRSYFDCTSMEIAQINAETSLNIPIPGFVIFGHTHQPIPWDDTNAPKAMMRGKNQVTLYNTGGWLNHRNKKNGRTEFCGAEVMVFDDSKTPQMRSVSIR
jgi:hypothetical protein